MKRRNLMMNPRKPTGKSHRAIIIHPKKIKWKVWAFKNSDHFQTTHKKRKKKKKKTYGSSWNKQKPMRDTENPVKSLQGIGVLDISFKHFQGVLERLSHGSYVHLPRTKKVRTFSRKTETKIKITSVESLRNFDTHKTLKLSFGCPKKPEHYFLALEVVGFLCQRHSDEERDRGWLLVASIRFCTWKQRRRGWVDTWT